MKTARVPGVLLAVLCAVTCTPALGQRERFPSTLPPTLPPTLPSTLPPTLPPTLPSTLPPALPSDYPPPSPGAVGPAPMATFEGTIQPPPSHWDPYGTPGTAPPTLLPEDPYFQFGAPGGYGGTFTTMRRFLDELRFDYVWMPGTSANEFGINDLELSATFAIPFMYNTETPILVTPGFAARWWNGPSAALVPSPDVPSRVFDAYLDAAWNPQVTQWLGGELALRVGVYSDFKKVTSDSLRFPSKGLLVLTFSPSFQVKAGVMYLDRHPVKILPAGGIVWTPNPDVRFEILFPNPKVARRLRAWGNTEWWVYARGEYGGGAWTVNRLAAGISPDLVGYNDLRASVGVEFIRLNGLTGLFEVGVSFDRELRYRSLSPTFFYPNTTVFLRAGLAY